ncbi:MAG: ribonucleoside triphosphate reductase [Verrucomicrobiales bacterium]|jgi:ribonucleoside-triphosphate reductase|nr:ribonucleoside triphosphate reductase [Verrucomicrobiales bacterium]
MSEIVSTVASAGAQPAADAQLDLINPNKLARPTFLVTKRDGSVMPFEEQRILLAIAKAGHATGEFAIDRAQALTSCVLAQLYLGKGAEFSVEDIQDAVELNLMQAGHFKTARAYIRYREQHRQLREEKKTFVDVAASIEEYIDKLDWRVNANANQGYSLGGMILNGSGKITANYWLSHVYPPEVGAAHRGGDFHIHDLDMLSGYCAGWSLRTLLHDGFNGVANKIEAAPPKRLRTALGQMVNFLGTLQNEWAGAQAFSSVDTYLAPFVRLEGLDFAQVKQSMQEFIFNLNVPSRWGTQTPFTNLTFDWTCPEDLKTQVPIVGGREVKFTYGDLQEEMNLINRAYIEVMMAGDAKGRVFTFPIPTYNITREFDWEHPNTELLFEMTAKYGLPYFQNFINSDLRPQDIRSMCCRLQLDLRELLKRGNGLFGSAEQTGSIGVVTINSARLGYVYADSESALLARLDELLRLAKTSLELKRKFVQRLADKGLFPFTKRYLPSLRNHFSTIGVNGLNECVRNFYADNEDISGERGRALALRILRHIRERMTEFQQETGHLYNLEASPAEGATYRFAREDQKRYAGILQAGTAEHPYYTNSSQLPVNFSSDPFDVLEHQEEFQQQYTGGTVLHLYMGERISSSRNCKMLVKNVLTRFRLPYITISPTFSICPTHGYIAGEHKLCPKCDAGLKVQSCEVWTRVMGYHRPVDQFNAGKRSEYAERQTFIEPAHCEQ